MSGEKVFYYFVAIYGAPPDYIDRYAAYFDANNYTRAMADEFERNRYRERIGARIADEVRKIDFSEKFTLIGGATLGEYSFESHSFPFVWLPKYSTCCGSMGCSKSCPIRDLSLFRVEDAVNGNDFNWSVPMSETDASAFVKSRSTAGNVNRNVMVRIIYSVVNKKGRYEANWSDYDAYRGLKFSPFIYSVEAFGDESLTQKLGVIPKINSLGASTAEELRLATVAAQTATKEIGKYRNMIEYRVKSDGKIRDPLKREPPRPQLFGTITLTDVGITLLDEQPDGSSETKRFRFFDSPASSLWRANGDYSAYLKPDKKFFSVVWRPSWQQPSQGYHFQFESRQERDRFFVDLTQAIQEWKTKYAPFQFAAGEVKVYEKCEVNTHFVPCSETTLSSEGKPVWQTPTYSVTVESLERKANNHIATLVFENLTDETIKIAWQKESSLVPDATGPYLIDESGEKYFAKGTDSGNILQDTMKYLWVQLPEILPKTKLTSRFLFIGNGNGTTFTLRAKEMQQDLGTRPVIIEGLKIGNQTGLPLPTPSILPAPTDTASSGSAPVTAPTTAAASTRNLETLSPSAAYDLILKGDAATNMRNLETLSAAVERGEEVVFKIKYDYAVPPYHYLHDGRLIVRKDSIAFDGTVGVPDFTVSPDKILEITNNPQQASRVHLKVAIKNKKGDKESKKDFDFYNLRAVTVGSGPGGTGLSIACNGCDDSMSVLYALIKKVRGKD